MFFSLVVGPRFIAARAAEANQEALFAQSTEDSLNFIETPSLGGGFALDDPGEGYTPKLYSGNPSLYEVSIVGATPANSQKLLPSRSDLLEPENTSDSEPTSRDSDESLPRRKLPQKSYFSMPAKGVNRGVLHGNNGIDISNHCGTSVSAAADGVVIQDPIFGSGEEGWNDGYGKFVLIKHPNGTQTRYAHLEEIGVRIGDHVLQGDPIATIGNSGDVHGPTGCHLHFEVYGAPNPFRK